MAVISPSAATGGRNTGFSYVFNASKAVFQDSVQSVIRKSKDVSGSIKCKTECAAEKCKDSVKSLVLQKDSVCESTTVKSSSVEPEVDNKYRTNIVRASSDNVVPSHIISPTEKSNTHCLNKTVSDKLEASENQKKPSSDKRFQTLTNVKKVRENTDVLTDVLSANPTPDLKATKNEISENVSHNRTSVQKYKLETTQISSQKPLINQSRPIKVQTTVDKSGKSRTDSGQTADNVSSKNQLNSDKITERDQKEGVTDTDEHLVKSQVQTTSRSKTNIKMVDKKSKKEGLQVIGNKCSSNKSIKDEKTNTSANDAIQQKGINISPTENVRKINTNENVQSFINKCTAEKSQTVDVNLTNKFLTQNLQTDKDGTSVKLGVKSRKESTSSISEQRDKVKLHTSKQTISSDSMDSQTDELSDKSTTKHQKDSQGLTNKSSPEKAQSSNLKIKTSEKPIIKSKKDTAPLSTNKISVKKLTEDNKDIETNKKTVAKSQISTNKISTVKSKKNDIKTEIDTSKQFVKSQEDVAQRVTSISAERDDIKNESAGKPIVSQKKIAKSSVEKFSAEKSQEDNLESDKSFVKSQKDSLLVSISKISAEHQSVDVKGETNEQSLTKLQKDITQYPKDKLSAEKLQGNNLTMEKSNESLQKNITHIYAGKFTEKLQQDDKQIKTTKTDASTLRNKAQVTSGKISLEKLEISKLKDESHPKSVVKSQKDIVENVMSKSIEKLQSDSLKDKNSEKQIMKTQKDVQSKVSRIITEKHKSDHIQDHNEKVQVGKLKDTTNVKSDIKGQKDVVSATSSVSSKEQKMDRNKYQAEKFGIGNVKDQQDKKVLSKSNNDVQSSVSKSSTDSSKETVKEYLDEKPIDKSQKDIDKPSSEHKLFAEKNILKDCSGAKLLTEKFQNITQDGATKTLSLIAHSNNKDTISVDTSMINCDVNLHSEVSAVKSRTNVTSHLSDTNEMSSQTTIEKCPSTFQADKVGSYNKSIDHIPTKFQKDSEKVSLNSKVSVSKKSIQQQNMQTTGIVSSETCAVLEDTFTNTSKPESTLKCDIGKTNIYNSSAKKEKLSKLQSKKSEVDFGKSNSGVPDIIMDSEIKAKEISSSNLLQLLCNKNSVSDINMQVIPDKTKDTSFQEEKTHPNHSAYSDTVSKTTVVNINNQILKPDIHIDNLIPKDDIYATQEQSVKNRRHIKENRPCSYPSSEYKDFAGLQQRSSSQQSLEYYTRDCTLSAVDYAKSRFQHVQQTPRCDEVVKPKPKHTQMVNEFKSLWESYEQKETDGLSIPHPTARRIHIRKRLSSLSPDGQSDADFPIRPFLTKGSVAERVLLFECCPERALDRSSGKSKSLLYNTWKSAGLHHKTKSFYIQRERENFEVSKAAAFCRFSKSSNIVDIPLFHYPQGRPLISTEIEKQLKEIKAAFSAFADEKVTKEEFGIITKACNLPLYWKLPLFLAAANEKKPFLKCDVFLQYWRRIISTYHDEASQFVAVLTKCTRNYLLPDDFILMIQDIIDTHPGLTFLKEASEFHSRYVHTVISRIYYCVNKSWSGKISVAELRKSNFLQIVSLLEKEDDINQITDYFSYEHFYVIYCKFWELDKDHDLFIDKNDLRRHNDGAISSRMIERIFSGAVTRTPVHKDGKMSYTDFVWFLFSEEDKRYPRSIEYWFRCMDLDGDGYLSMYEMEYFYEEQLQRMEALNIETLPFKDCLCQMLDMIRPKIPGLISLTDLKKCKMTPLFFDTFFNLEKYLDHEQRDPFASQREQDTDSGDMSDWDRYAAEEYELLVAEEGSSEQPDDLIYEDYTQDDDELLSDAQQISGSSVINRSSSTRSVTDEEDYADSDLTYY